MWHIFQYLKSTKQHPTCCWSLVNPLTHKIWPRLPLTSSWSSISASICSCLVCLPRNRRQRFLGIAFVGTVVISWKKNYKQKLRNISCLKFKVILHQFWVKKIFPWKFNMEYGSTFTKLFMHVSSRNMFPTTRNLQIRVYAYCSRHYCGDWLTFGCFVPMIADHNIVKKSFGPMIADHDLVKKR